MDSADKPERVTGGSREEDIVPKNMPAAGEPAELETFDCQPEAPVATDDSEASPIEGKPAWHWAAERDMPGLQLLHFEAEVASGQAAYLPELPSNLRPIAVAAKDGKILAGLMSEDSVVVTLIEMDPEVLESAGEVVIPILVAQARKERTRFLHCSLPAKLAATLDGALQKIGFKPVDGIQYRLDTGVEADEQDSTRRN